MRALRLIAIILPLALGGAAHAGESPAQATATHAPRTTKGKPPLHGTVNLNTGDEAALEMLPGIGEAKAERIVTHRKAHPFKKVDDLVKVRGFGRKTLQKLRPYLTVSGPNTLSDEAAAPK